MNRFLGMIYNLNIFLILVFMLVFHSCTNQSQNGSSMNSINRDANSHKFNKELFVSKCITCAKKDERNKVIDIDKYCKCVAEKLEQNQNDTELVRLVNGFDHSGSTLSQMEYLYSIPKMKVIIDECVQGIMSNNPEAKMPVSTSEERKALIRQFKKNLSAQDYESIKDFVVNIDSFCGCYIDKITQQFTIREMQDTNFINNPLRQQILKDCLLKNEK